MRLWIVIVVAFVAASAAAQQPHLAVDIPAVADPGQEVRMTVSFRVTGGERHDIRLRASLPPYDGAVAIEPGSWSCTIAERVVECTKAVVTTTFEPVRITFRTASPGRSPWRVSVAAAGTELTSRSNTLSVVRPFPVTSAADSGPGTLRQAILDANAECQPGPDCRIALNVERIEPAAALPEVRTRTPLIIEPLAVPRTVLDGRAVAEGSGLTFAGTDDLTIRNLTIESFPGDGIFFETIESGSLFLERLRVLRNRYRGLSMHAPRTQLLLFDGAFEDNGRSGMAIWAAHQVMAYGSFLRNGASGVFVHTISRFNLYNSVIADNVHFGIALAAWKPAAGMTPSQALFATNDIRNNGVRNVDWGLDGETPRDPSDAVPDAPEILSARYDPATGKTTVRGVLRSPANTYRGYEASAVTGELEPDGTVQVRRDAIVTQLIAQTSDIPRPTELPFALVLTNAPPGTWVSVFGTDYSLHPLDGLTSEISRAIRVVEP